VCITGGEPLLHKDMPEIVAGFIRRKKFVYLGTNGPLLKAHIKITRHLHHADIYKGTQAYLFEIRSMGTGMCNQTNGTSREK
jgi:organic radical activating enzyme